MAVPFQVTKNWLNLSSSDRSSGTSNNFTINFNNGGITNNTGGFYGSTSYINPIWFSFPNNAPNIQDNFNNVFYISGNLFAGATPYALLTLTQGVYQNIEQLAFALTTTINTYINAIHGTTLPTAYTGTISVLRNGTNTSLDFNKLVFTFTPGSGETLNIYLFTGTPINYVVTNPYNFGSVVGTNENVFTLSASTPNHTLPYLPNLQVYDIIQIKCNLCKSTYELEFNGSATTNGVLSTSLIMVSFPSANFTVNDSILFTNNNPFLYRQEMNTPNFGTIEIQVCDKNGRLIPFFGEMDFSLTIEREQYNEPINLARVKGDSPYTAPTFYQ